MRKSFLVFDIDWAKGAPRGLPDEATVEVPEYMRDADDDEFDALIVEELQKQFCAIAESFSFEPVDG